MKNSLYSFLCILLVSIFCSSFGIDKLVEWEPNEILGSCSQISSNEFLVHSDNEGSCILWGYVNVKGKVQLDIETYETDTKVYVWWTTGDFLMKTPIEQLNNDKNTLNIPKARKARLNLKTVCGSAKVTLKEMRKNKVFKN